MSEQAPERPPASTSTSAARPQHRPGMLGLFGEKIGPLPMWGWVTIIGGLLVAWRMYAARQAANANAATSGTTSTPADQVPQFINQTYTTVTAPVSTPPPAGNPPATSPQPTPKPGTGKTGGKQAPPMPEVKAGRVTASSISASWPKVTGATSYHWRVTYQDKLVKQGDTTSPSVTIPGLGADHTYTIHVASVGPGGTSSETNGPGIMTSR